MAFDHNDPSILWVSPGGTQHGDGTYDDPFQTVSRAAEKAQPGDTILLKPGVYSSDLTFDLSGTIKRPIRITAEVPGETEIRGACWFFYDVNDLVVTGLVFRGAPNGAVSVIGACNRNRFADLRFIDCGTRGDTSCTLYFGGAGASCNLVENCSFERSAPALPEGDGELLSIGLMVGDGDGASGAPIINHIIRKNRFVNYHYGILVGSGDAPASLNGHVVEYNTVEESGREAILVKCGDTTVRGNLVLRSRQNSIGIGAGSGSIVEANRILDCANGIMVNGADHTIANNCIVRCTGHAIAIRAASAKPPQSAAENLIVENNTCVDCGSEGQERIAGIRIEPGTSCVIRKNLFSGTGKPYARTDTDHAGEPVFVCDNLAANRCEPMDGVDAGEIAFPGNDDFSNGSGYGADGWMLRPEGFNPMLDTADEAEGYCETDLDEEDDADAGDEPVDESGPIADERAQFDAFMQKFYRDHGG